MQVSTGNLAIVFFALVALWIASMPVDLPTWVRISFFAILVLFQIVLVAKLVIERKK
jgi:membrane protein implicated in regulation of membrane protease activity